RELLGFSGTVVRILLVERVAAPLGEPHTDGRLRVGQHALEVRALDGLRGLGGDRQEIQAWGRAPSRSHPGLLQRPLPGRGGRSFEGRGDLVGRDVGHLAVEMDPQRAAWLYFPVSHPAARILRYHEQTTFVAEKPRHLHAVIARWIAPVKPSGERRQLPVL